MTETITFDDFVERFKPISNHLDESAGVCLNDGTGCLFSAYGPEGDFVRAQDESKVWSVIEGDDGLSISNGFHMVNLFGYIVTEIPAPEDSDIVAHDEPEDEDAPLTPDAIERIFDDLGEADFSDNDDTIDKDDIESRIDEIEKAFEESGLDIDTTEKTEGGKREPSEWPDDAPQNAWDAWHELETLRPMVDDRYIDGPFIHETHFTDYAKALCEDIGDAKIPDYIVIDWEATAENIRQDYTTYDFNGQTFYAR